MKYTDENDQDNLDGNFFDKYLNLYGYYYSLNIWFNFLNILKIQLSDF